MFQGWSSEKKVKYPSIWWPSLRYEQQRREHGKHHLTHYQKNPAPHELNTKLNPNDEEKIMKDT
jgi:hypothetical protein